jgi:hypothetical protein
MGRALLFSLLFFTTSGTLPQDEDTELRTKLDARVTQYSVSASGLADALIKISKQFQIPMGIEWVRDKETSRGLTRTWSNETIREILRPTVKEYPGYDLRVEEGVIHVFRQDLRNESRNFLNLKIPDFFEVHQKPAGLANVELRAVVQNMISPRNLPPGTGEGGSYATGIRENSVSLTLRGSNIRKALEKLAAVSEHNIWVVTFSDTTALTPTGCLRTETLWHPTPFPNSQQPMWDFLAWGEPSPGTERAAH